MSHPPSGNTWIVPRKAYPSSSVLYAVVCGRPQPSQRLPHSMEINLYKWIVYCGSQ